MSQEQYIWQMAEAAIAGSLSSEQSRELEARLAADDSFAQAYNESLNLLRGLNDNGEQRRFRATLKAIHQDIAKPVQKSRAINFRPGQFRTAAIAAGVALLTFSITALTMQQSVQKNATSRVTNLSHQMNALKQQQQQQQRIIQDIKNQQETPQTIAPSNYTGTGFALTNDGYLITNYHVTDGADSIYIQTRNGNYYKARVIAFEPRTDVAILKVEDKKFRFGKGELPYTFANAKLSLGSKIYTLGFPQNEIVYNEGYVSSRNGYEGDSMQYRLEVAAAPGQSGSPVLDNSGNIVGIVKAKDDQTVSTTYAISSKALLGLLTDLNAGIKLPKTSKMSNFTREQQIEKIQDYTCMIQVYKHQN